MTLVITVLTEEELIVTSDRLISNSDGTYEKGEKIYEWSDNHVIATLGLSSWSGKNIDKHIENTRERILERYGDKYFSNTISLSIQTSRFDIVFSETFPEEPLDDVVHIVHCGYDRENKRFYISGRKRKYNNNLRHYDCQITPDLSEGFNHVKAIGYTNFINEEVLALNQKMNIKGEKFRNYNEAIVWLTYIWERALSLQAEKQAYFYDGPIDLYRIKKEKFLKGTLLSFLRHDPDDWYKYHEVKRSKYYSYDKEKIKREVSYCPYRYERKDDLVCEKAEYRDNFRIPGETNVISTDVCKKCELSKIHDEVNCKNFHINVIITRSFQGPEFVKHSMCCQIGNGGIGLNDIEKCISGCDNREPRKKDK